MLLDVKKENIITKMLPIRRLMRNICSNTSDDCPMHELNLSLIKTILKYSLTTSQYIPKQEKPIFDESLKSQQNAGTYA